MSTTCPLDHDKPKSVLAPIVVCTWHYDRTQQAVSELPALYSALERRLVTSGAGSLSGLPSGSRDPGIALNHRVVACRTNIRNNLSTWARAAIEERRMTYPSDTIPAIAAFIVRQLDWYLSQPFAKQVVNDFIDDWRTARGLTDPNNVRQFEVGPCPEADCPGTLYARIRPKDDLLPSDVTCNESPEDDDGNLLHIWPAEKWMTLGRRVARNATG